MHPSIHCSTICNSQAIEAIIYLSICVAVCKWTPPFLSLLNKYNLYINHVPGTVLSTIRKKKINQTWIPYQVAASFSESNPQSNHVTPLIEIFSMPAKRMTSKLFNRSLYSPSWLICLPQMCLDLSCDDAFSKPMPSTWAICLSNYPTPRQLLILSTWLISA